MRHRVAYRKLGRITPHRMALLRNLATALFERERIRTTLHEGQGAAALRREAHHPGQARGRPAARPPPGARDIQDPAVVKKLFDTLGARFAARPGGYTRILRLGPRKGDGAEMAIVELLGSEYKPAGKDGKAPRRPPKEGSRAQEQAEEPPPRRRRRRRGRAKKKAERRPSRTLPARERRASGAGAKRAAPWAALFSCGGRSAPEAMAAVAGSGECRGVAGGVAGAGTADGAAAGGLGPHDRCSLVPRAAEHRDQVGPVGAGSTEHPRRHGLLRRGPEQVRAGRPLDRRRPRGADREGTSTLPEVPAMRARGGTTGRRPRVRSGTPGSSVTSRMAETPFSGVAAGGGAVITSTGGAAVAPAAGAVARGAGRPSRLAARASAGARTGEAAAGGRSSGARGGEPWRTGPGGGEGRRGPLARPPAWPAALGRAGVGRRDAAGADAAGGELCGRRRGRPGRRCESAAAGGSGRVAAGGGASASRPDRCSPAAFSTTAARPEPPARHELGLHPEGQDRVVRRRREPPGPQRGQQCV